MGKRLGGILSEFFIKRENSKGSNFFHPGWFEAFPTRTSEPEGRIFACLRKFGGARLDLKRSLYAAAEQDRQLGC